MNPVLILTHNNLELTKKCVESVLAQDIPVDRIRVFDNLSNDGTQAWLMEQPYPLITPGLALENKGVSYGWNRILREEFNGGSEHVLVLNNDTILPSWFYRRLLECDAPFVTGVSVGSMAEIAEEPSVKELIPYPDFSAFLIRREAWDAIGHFDESMVSYASDMDYHIRSHRKGISLWNSGIPFYHERSSTIKTASPKEKRMLQLQADADRFTFTKKWGCATSGPSYDAMFSDENFGIDA